MVREAKTNKILVLGVDGMDPRLTKKFMDQGKLPHIKEYVEKRCLPGRFNLVRRYADYHTSAVGNSGNWSLSGNPWNYLFLESVKGKSG